MLKYSVPCVISLLVAALYNIVDQIFIANASYLGSYGNAANTVVYPLTVIALAVAVMVGDGCCAFVSLTLGKNRPEDARKSVASSVMLSLAAGILLCAVYLVLKDPIMIYIFKWGMMGAAIATVIGQIITAVLSVWYICNMKLAKPRRNDFSLRRRGNFGSFGFPCG